MVQENVTQLAGIMVPLQVQKASDFPHFLTLFLLVQTTFSNKSGKIAPKLTVWVQKIFDFKQCEHA